MAKKCTQCGKEKEERVVGRGMQGREEKGKKGIMKVVEGKGGWR